MGTGSPSVSAQIADVQRLVEKSGLKYVMHSAGTTLGELVIQKKKKFTERVLLTPCRRTMGQSPPGHWTGSYPPAPARGCQDPDGYPGGVEVKRLSVVLACSRR